MLRRLISTAVLVLCLGVLIGCGGSTTPTPPTTPNGAAPAADSTKPAPAIKNEMKGKAKRIPVAPR